MNSPRAKGGHPKTLVWIDLETSGVNPKKHQILEIAVVVTDCLGGPLTMHPASEALEFFVDYDPEDINWQAGAYEMHKKSGLIDEMARAFSAQKKDLISIEHYVCLLLQRLGVEARTTRLAGRSVHFDRGFLEVYMPRVLGFLSNRHVDVSSIKEFLVAEELMEWDKRDAPHRAMADIRDTIADYRKMRELIRKAR